MNGLKLEETLAVPTCMQVPFGKPYKLSTALIVKETGEIIAERLGPIKHIELFKRFVRQTVVANG